MERLRKWFEMGTQGEGGAGGREQGFHEEGPHWMSQRKAGEVLRLQIELWDAHSCTAAGGGGGGGGGGVDRGSITG